MQKYCLVHSSSDPFVGPTVGGRRLSMARLGQQIVDEPIPLAGLHLTLIATVSGGVGGIS